MVLLGFLVSVSFKSVGMNNCNSTIKLGRSVTCHYVAWPGWQPLASSDCQHATTLAALLTTARLLLPAKQGTKATKNDLIVIHSRAVRRYQLLLERNKLSSIQSSLRGTSRARTALAKHTEAMSDWTAGCLVLFGEDSVGVADKVGFRRPSPPHSLAYRREAK